MAIAALLLIVFISLSIRAVVTWLTFMYACSYVKLAITLIKYVPQVCELRNLDADMISTKVIMIKVGISV